MGKCMEEMCRKVRWMDENWITVGTAEHFVFLDALGSLEFFRYERRTNYRVRGATF